MTKSNDDKFIPLVQELQEFAFSQVGSMTILRVLGYGLLLLALIDTVDSLYPANLMNPGWEFETFGKIVERVPVPLIGFVMVFYGELQSRGKWEFITLKLFSWLSLLLAILLLVLIPLAIGNTVRLNKQGVAQISTASKQQISQAEQVETQLNQATPEQISSFLKSQGRSVDTKNPQEIKSQVLSEVAKAKAQIKAQAQATQSSRRMVLLKSSIKWNLGALISAALFFILWKETRWARVSR